MSLVSESSSVSASSTTVSTSLKLCSPLHFLELLGWFVRPFFAVPLSRCIFHLFFLVSCFSYLTKDVLLASIVQTSYSSELFPTFHVPHLSTQLHPPSVRRRCIFHLQIQPITLDRMEDDRLNAINMLLKNYLAYIYFLVSIPHN